MVLRYVDRIESAESISVDKTATVLTRQLPLMNQLMEAIERDIGSGRIRPGERLVEAKLAHAFGVSRGPVRDALKAIEAGGLIEQRNGGLHVICPTPDDAEGMFVMRAQLEGLAARSVAADCNPEIVLTLRKIVDSMRIAAHQEDRLSLVELDWAFHETVCSGTRYRFLLEFWRSMRTMIRIFQGANVSVGTDLDALVERHVELIEVLIQGDPDKAEEMFRRRILDLGFRLIGRRVPQAFRSLVESKPV
jgi:DNA-binding GntR family transcriptional regulator